ncbi:hypothetical protein ECPA3_2222, partial [Escherichia coli PA3]
MPEYDTPAWQPARQHTPAAAP